MITNTLKFCSWNIHGYSSRLLGNKFEDEDFLDTFKDVDVVGLTETHIHDEVLDQMNIPGFHRLKVKNQPKNEKSNKASKGIAVFVRENKRNLFRTRLESLCNQLRQSVCLSVCQSVTKVLILPTIRFF